LEAPGHASANNKAYDTHAEWRTLDVDGQSPHELPGRLARYRTCCPNSAPYRAFVEAQVSELCERYAFEGVFFDLTFWPGVCYCQACRGRFAREIGGELPETIDWADQRWRTFQRKREEWLAELAAFATGLVKERKPEASVQHNSAVTASGWRLATSLALVDANDYIGGDLYGGLGEQSTSAAVPHLRAVTAAAAGLRQAHLPHGVITRRNLGDLDRYQAVVLTGVLAIDDDEVAALRRFVERGGGLYVSGQPASAGLAVATLVRSLCRRPLSYEVAAPAAVEVTVFLQPERSRAIIAAVNAQRDLPPIPVRDVRLRVRTDGRTPTRATLLPEASPLPFEVEDGYVAITVPELRLFRMIALELT
jgi:hypothetical protein